ncbi:MAG: cation diffusion facilitator family transporter [Planctomycetaceae bacterium]|nr:cation diffusion facilitator family transporter [Planctomycetaceae bacterium]
MTSNSNNANSSDTIQAVRRITWVGFWVNLILSGLKLFAGIVGNSSVLIADAVHTLSDLVTDVVILVGSRFWDRPADEDHPYGHAKIETMVTFFIGLVLVLVAFGLFYDAVMTIFEMLGDKEFPSPTWLPLVVAVIGIIVKEYVYRITVKVGMNLKSSALIANAWHHRSDALSSIPAAITVAACLILGDSFAFLDPVGTIVVAMMIVYAAWEIVRPTFAALLDAGASETQRNEIAEIIRSFPEVNGLHKLRTRHIGPTGLAVDVHIQVAPGMSLRETHALSHRIQERLLESDKDILDVFVHVEPYEK